MKRGTLLAGLILLSFSGIAQTARIAHRSHSVSGQSFNLNEDDNFGIPYKQEPVKQVPDTSKNLVQRPHARATRVAPSNHAPAGRKTPSKPRHTVPPGKKEGREGVNGARH